MHCVLLCALLSAAYGVRNDDDIMVFISSSDGYVTV